MTSVSQRFFLTVQGKNKYKADLERLYSYLQRVAQRLRSLRRRNNLDEDGDWEYTMQEYDYATKRIDEIEKVLENCQVITTGHNKKSIRLGTIVRAQNGTNSQQFVLVDPLEADPLEGKISIKSPLGRALLGKRVQDQIHIDAPAGRQTYIIKKVR